MNFNQKIGFICRNKKEWTTCQSILNKKGFTWQNTNSFKRLDPYKNKMKKNQPLIIHINYNFENKMSWCKLEQNNCEDCKKLYESNILLRSIKLKKLKIFVKNNQ